MRDDIFGLEKEMTSLQKMSSLLKMSFLVKMSSLYQKEITKNAALRGCIFILIPKYFYNTNPSCIVAPFLITTMPSFTTNKE